MSERAELITPGPAEALAGLFDITSPPREPGDSLPPLWHWVYFLERTAQRGLRADGYSGFGAVEPALPGKITLFAGGRVKLLSPVLFGEIATRTTELSTSVEKEGRSGPMTFVTIRSEIRQGGSLAIVEEQDLVYVPQPTELGDRIEKSVAAPGVPEALGSNPVLEMDINPVILFRFSALTYNAHRIHYDLAYAESEGHPGLVVHGPLQALLMGESFRRSGLLQQRQEFSYRLMRPTFGNQVLSVLSVTDASNPGMKIRDGRGFVTAVSSLHTVD